MKNRITASIYVTIGRLLLLLLLIPGYAAAQTDSTAAKDSSAKEEELISPSLEFVTVQKQDSDVDLKATLKAKINGNFTDLRLLKVSFVQVLDTAENKLGFVITDERGKAVLHVKNSVLVPAKDGSLHFKAVFAGNKQMEAAEEEATIKKAMIALTASKADSTYNLTAKLVAPGTENDPAIKDVTIGIYVQRSFFPLKIGEGTTDENGEVSVEVPGNLPGDDQGNIVLLAKVEENENFGNLESATTQKWGVPVSDKIVNQPRALWSSHPPLWMLITFIVLMAVVWGHYIVIVFQLFRLRKEEPATA